MNRQRLQLWLHQEQATILRQQAQDCRRTITSWIEYILIRELNLSGLCESDHFPSHKAPARYRRRRFYSDYVHVLLTEEMLQALQKRAEKRGIAVAEVVRRTLARVAPYPKPTKTRQKKTGLNSPFKLFRPVSKKS